MLSLLRVQPEARGGMLAGQRLSFEQAGMQGPALLPAQDILAAVSGPSVPNFLRQEAVAEISSQLWCLGHRG